MAEEKKLEAEKGIIAVISDHGDYFRNESLAKLFNDLLSESNQGTDWYRDKLENFYFVFTGGTFSRIFHSTDYKSGFPLLHDSTKKWLKEHTIQLPSFERGGVALLTYLLIEDKCKTIWSFQSPDSPHHLVSQNSILRLASNVKGVKRLINTKTVKEWIDNGYYIDEIPKDVSENPICGFSIPI